MLLLVECFFKQVGIEPSFEGIKARKKREICLQGVKENGGSICKGPGAKLELGTQNRGIWLGYIDLCG